MGVTWTIDPLADLDLGLPFKLQERQWREQCFWFFGYTDISAPQLRKLSDTMCMTSGCSDLASGDHLQRYRCGHAPELSAATVLLKFSCDRIFHAPPGFLALALLRLGNGQPQLVDGFGHEVDGERERAGLLLFSQRAVDALVRARLSIQAEGGDVG